MGRRERYIPPAFRIMTTKHTPGPWRVSKHAHRWIETADSRECVAEILVRDQMSANAQLIAAAPDMLALLLRIQADPVWRTNDIRLWKDIGDTIAKAEGCK